MTFEMKFNRHYFDKWHPIRVNGRRASAGHLVDFPHSPSNFRCTMPSKEPRPLPGLTYLCYCFVLAFLTFLTQQ